MRRPGGYYYSREPSGRTREADTFTCAHSGRVVFVKPFCDPADMGGLCSCCGKLICKEELGKPCITMEQQLARMEARRSYDLAG